MFCPIHDFPLSTRIICGAEVWAFVFFSSHLDAYSFCGPQLFGVTRSRQHEPEIICMVLLSWVQRGEPEFPALLDPTERQAVGKFLKGQIGGWRPSRIASTMSGARKAFQNPAYVSLVEAELLCNGSLTGNFSGHDPFVPLASACHGLQ